MGEGFLEMEVAERAVGGVSGGCMWMNIPERVHKLDPPFWDNVGLTTNAIKKVHSACTALRI